MNTSATPNYKRLAADLLNNMYGEADPYFVAQLATRIARYALYRKCYSRRIGEEGQEFEINAYTTSLMEDCIEEVKDIRAEINKPPNYEHT